VKPFSSLLEAALYYRSIGWSVVPGKPGDKGGYYVKWKPYQKILPSIREIREWWKRWPEANVALVTGKVSNTVVIDFDQDKLKDKGTPKAFWEQHPTQLISRTGSGGFHCFYRYPQESKRVRNQTEFDGVSGIDVRGDGGIAILPPSTHKTGNLYEWYLEGKASNVDKTLLKKLQKQRKKKTKVAEGEGWIGEALSRGVSKGNRDNTATALAGFFLGKKIPPDIVLQTLLDWNRKNDPPLSKLDIEKCIASIDRREREKAEEESSEFLLGYQDFLFRHLGSSQPWLVKDWLPAETIHFIVAPPESWKSWMAHDLAISVSTGKDFLGGRVHKTGPVLIFQLEDSHHTTAARLNMIHAAKNPEAFELEVGGVSFENYDMREWEEVTDFEASLSIEWPKIHMHDRRAFSFTEERMVDRLVEAVRTIRPVLVIIDPLYYVVDSENYFLKAPVQMRVLKRLRDEVGCSFVLVHHTRKPPAAAGAKKQTKEPIARSETFGSQLLDAFSESSWQVRQTEDSKIVRVQRIAKQSERVGEVTLSFMTEGEDYSVEIEKPIPLELEKKAVLKEGEITIPIDSRELNVMQTSGERVVLPDAKDA